MVTRDAAAILKWHKALGSLEPGKRADLVVISGKAGDPYEALIKAQETSIRLVMINGIARYGTPGLMSALGPVGEKLHVGGKERRLFLQQETADPDVSSVSLGAARSALRAALGDLPNLARELERPKPAIASRAVLDAPVPLVWSLALDEIGIPGSTCARGYHSTAPPTSRGRRGSVRLQPPNPSRQFCSPWSLTL